LTRYDDLTIFQWGERDFSKIMTICRHPSFSCDCSCGGAPQVCLQGCIASPETNLPCSPNHGALIVMPKNQVGTFKAE
jgi:hypothetical protein